MSNIASAARARGLAGGTRERPNKRSPDAVDRYVGARIRGRRLMLGLSLTELADALELTFQQLRKYEKGANRVGAGRLQQIANALQVPISFFFDGAPGAAFNTIVGGDPLRDLGMSRDGIALARAFNSIADRATRAGIVTIVETAAQVLAPPARKARAA